MSRIGKKPVIVPDKVKVAVNGDIFTSEGPIGREEVRIPPLARIRLADNLVHVERLEDTPDGRRIHGLTRALVANALHGVSASFKKELDIVGVGFRAEVKGNALNLALGFSHPVAYLIPKGIKIAVEKQTRVAITGSNRELVGRVASEIRRFRPPEPYKGKGVKYSDETIKRKVGKAATGTAAGGK